MSRFRAREQNVVLVVGHNAEVERDSGFNERRELGSTLVGEFFTAGLFAYLLGLFDCFRTSLDLRAVFRADIRGAVYKLTGAQGFFFEKN